MNRSTGTNKVRRNERFMRGAAFAAFQNGRIKHWLSRSGKGFLALLLAIMIIPLSSGHVAYAAAPTWTPTGSSSPSNVYALADVGGKLYAGTYNGDSGGDVWEYQDSVWKQMSGSPSNAYSLANVDGTLYAGAQNGDEDVWAYIDGDWKPMSGSPSYVSAFVNMNDTLYVGTQNGDNDVWSYRDETWTNLPDSPANVYSMIDMDGVLYVGTRNGVWLYDDVNDNWIRMDDSPGDVYALVNVNGTLYAGSQMGSGNGGVWTYSDDDDDTWTQLSDTPQNVRNLVYANGTLYAGTLNGNNDVWSYSNDVWTQLSDSPRNVYALLASDSQLYAGLGTGIDQLLISPSAPTADFAGGDGSEDSPYEIQTAQQLNRVRNYLNASFKLIADIGLSGYLANGGAGYNGGAGWVPIGTANRPFTGTFDGNGMVITGLHIHRPSEDNQGLFGYTASGAKIQDVGLTGTDVTGNNGVGALVGSNSGSIENTFVSGTVTGIYSVGGLAGYSNGEIWYSYAMSKISGNGVNVGGLVGENSSSIIYSYSEGAVTGSHDIGGLVGKNNWEIQQSYATGAVTSNQFGAGGLIGYNDGGNILTSFATGSVKSIGDNVGGLIGANVGGGSVDHTFAAGTVEGNDHVGGLIGVNVDRVTNSYASGIVQGRNDVGGLVGQSQSSSDIKNSFANGAVFGFNDVGGLIGSNEGYLGDAYATGAVKGNDAVGGLVGHHQSSSIENTYASGAVDANTPNLGVGGLVGVRNGNVNYSYYDMETTGQLDDGKREGKYSDDMKKQSTYVGWTFPSTWSIEEETNNGYPYLSDRFQLTLAVYYDKNGATSGNLPSGGDSHELGTMVTVLGNSGNLENPGYTFAGWNTRVDGKGKSYAAGDTFTMGNEYVTLYAMWTVNPTYTVTFDRNGGDADANPTSKTATHGGNVGSLPTEPTRSGFTFSGWNTVALGSGTSFNETTAVTGNMTVYAQWTLKSYSVTFKDWDETVLKTETVNHGSNATAPADPTRIGYTFTGWSSAFTNVAADVTVLAQYTVIKYTISFDSNEGSTVDAFQADFGKTINAPNNPTRDGYRFDGWYKEAGLNQVWDFDVDTVPVNGKTLYAKWTIKTYNVTFKDWDETVLKTETVNHGYNATAPADPTRIGYTFTGWSSAFTNVAANVTVLAQYTVNKYTISFDSNKGSTVDAFQADFGTKINAPNNPTRDGYRFNGWYKEPGLNQAWDFDVDTVPVNGKTLYAKWTVNNTGGSPGGGSPSGGSPSGGSSNGGSSSTSSSDTVISTNGKLTLAVGQKGELSLGDKVKIVIPADAFDKELRLTIDIVADTQNLLTSKDVLASPVFEILKNVPENFIKPITLTFTFDPKSFKDYQKPSVFFYDESKQVWAEIGGEVNGNTITVKVDHFTKFAVFAIGQMTETDGETKQPVTFSDVSGHWAEANIKQSVSMGFVNGYPDGTFNPNGSITRAEFIVMLVGALKLEGSSEALAFTDNDQIGAWAKQAVARAVQAGIVSGYEDGSFRPNARITRAEMAVMIARVLKLSLDANATTGFADDGEIPKWAKAAVEMIRKQGIVSGRSGNKFVPNDTATRAEAVVILLRMLEARAQQQ